MRSEAHQDMAGDKVTLGKVHWEGKNANKIWSLGISHHMLKIFIIQIVYFLLKLVKY